jgi:hypothetical protein
MYCPFCEKELVKDIERKYQSLNDYVCNPNAESYPLRMTFGCGCELGKNCFWDKDGGLYVKEYTQALHDFTGYKSAVGSIGRKIDIEIYKHDEDFQFLNLFGWRFKVEYHYESNYNGDILSRKPSIKVIRPDGVLYISGIHMLVYCIKMHFIRRNHKGDYWNSELKSDFEYPKYDVMKRDWWRWVVPFVLRIADHGYYKSIIN